MGTGGERLGFNISTLYKSQRWEGERIDLYWVVRQVTGLQVTGNLVCGDGRQVTTRINGEGG
jgi:hypothetical protein